MSTLGELGEFDLIARIRARAGAARGSQVVVGIGDDAAVLRPRAGEDLVVSTDTLVEDVHFRFRNQAPATIGRRALRVNLSDLAAMGARPLGFTLALSAPPKLPVPTIDALLRGLLADADDYDCPLVGGNIARADDVQLAVTAFGSVPRGRALRRDAARAGDRVFVTGTLGAAGLALVRSERQGSRLRTLPEPRVAAGRALIRRRDVGACIDVSDGLASDLGHVLSASDVGAVIDPAALPLPRGFGAACAREGLDPTAVATRAGEDYELLFTLRRRKGRAQGREPTPARLAKQLGVPVSEIGQIVAGRGLRGLASGTGFRHF
ncbi:MAG: thiamine-phosphate kinase [Myxococcota bacterium]|jgi:thiamine-monophosphate kinase|nr:thiamine-phosphate kinase [Myxococcota bacterium]